MTYLFRLENYKFVIGDRINLLMKKICWIVLFMLTVQAQHKVVCNSFVEVIKSNARHMLPILQKKTKYAPLALGYWSIGMGFRSLLDDSGEEPGFFALDGRPNYRLLAIEGNKSKQLDKDDVSGSRRTVQLAILSALGFLLNKESRPFAHYLKRPFYAAGALLCAGAAIFPNLQLASFCGGAKKAVGGFKIHLDHQFLDNCRKFVQNIKINVPSEDRSVGFVLKSPLDFPMTTPSRNLEEEYDNLMQNLFSPSSLRKGLKKTFSIGTSLGVTGSLASLYCSYLLGKKALGY